MVVQRIVHVVNRSCEQLEVMDDGVPWVIRPGYKRVEKLDGDGKPMLDPETGEPLFDIVGNGPGNTVLMEPLPYFAAERAKRQNPVMGTEDPYNPQSFEKLIAVPDWGDDYSPLEQSASLERLDRTQLPDEAQQAVAIQGVGARRKVTVRGKDGKFRKVDPSARAAVQGEAIPVNPGLTTQALL